MPAGVSGDALFGALVDLVGADKAQVWWRWFTTEHRGWAQEGWKRLDDARPKCPT